MVAIIYSTGVHPWNMEEDPGSLKSQIKLFLSIDQARFFFALIKERAGSMNHELEIFVNVGFRSFS